MTSSDKNADKRRDAVLLRMLKTPPKRHDEMKAGKSKERAKHPAKSRASAKRGTA
jgi:hypothetical protein